MVELKKRVSFDFDSTLDMRVVQDYAFELIERGFEVWICTARFDNAEAFKRWGSKNWNEDLYAVAKSLKIPDERIIFCNMELKSDVIGKDNKFLWHLDDCTVEVNNLNLDGNIPAILRAKYNNWKQKCNQILNRSGLSGTNILLWLDDVRDPFSVDNKWISKYAPEYFEVKNSVVWVKNYKEFTNWILNNGLPEKIAFDHDLADRYYDNQTQQENVIWHEKTGMDCAKWVVDYCIDYKQPLPLWVCQSANPVGAENINKLLTSYLKNHD